jgi:hypothetical protein
MAERLLDPRDLPPRSRWIALALVGAALLCAAVGQLEFGLADATGHVQYDVATPHRNAALAAYALAIAAMAALCRWTRRWQLPRWSRSGRWALGVLMLVAIAAWLRFHRLADLPPGLWVDEALNGVQALQIAARGRPLVALPAADPRTGLGAGYVNLAALAFALFDPSDGTYALRAVAAVLGVAGVAALGALAWMLYGVRAALAASAWLAVSQWHLNYSRWGEMPIMSPLIETLIGLGVVVGWRARGWRSWIGFLSAGLFAGAGLYTYQTFRLFVVLAAAVALPFALSHRRRLAQHGRALAVAALLGLAAAAPMAHYAATEPAAFAERARDTFIFARADWRRQLGASVPRSLLAFQLIGDENPRHNLPFAPLLTFLPALLAPLGLAVCLARWREPAYAIAPLWFAIAMVPAMVTLEAPHATRLLDASVPLALFVGVAADVLLGVVRASLPARGARLAVAAAALGAFVTAAQEYRAYFVERERRPEFVDGFMPWESAPARYLMARAPTATVFLDPITYDSPTTHFVARRYFDTLPNDVRMLRLQHDFPPREALAREALYLLPRPYASLAAVIRAMWAGTSCDEMRDRFGRITMVACRVPQPALASAPGAGGAGEWRSPYGLRGRFYASTAPDAAAESEAMLAFPFCQYALDEPPLGRFARAVWEGFIDVARPGPYLFRLHPDSTALAIDGREVIAHAGDSASGAGHDGRIELPAGRFPLRITLEPRNQTPVFLWFVWQPPGGAVEIVPATVLHPPE